MDVGKPVREIISQPERPTIAPPEPAREPVKEPEQVPEKVGAPSE